MLFGQNPVNIPETLSIKIMNKIIEHKQIVNYLGIYTDEELDWHEHINYIKLCSGIVCHEQTKALPTQLTHNVFITLLESCAELLWDKRCSNRVATFDQIYFVWQ